ncbi:thioredoxin family protein [Lignipirellula cremea]|uniref:Peroxiredoxin n=1 Tax=Lignipirellula cremea TaxID=2528010 RepID=A0A518DQ01_9BACT|nr:thioredoxin family protein [Lignipirellula cremea]QDU93917.1 Putative peroxiredoxin [Lignipirellula cremea]
MRHALLFFLSIALLGSAASAGEYNQTLSIGDTAPAWNDLPGVDGKTYSLKDLEEKKVVVVAFTCNSCPYAVDYEDRMIALAKKYGGENGQAALVAINVNKVESDLPAAMKQRAEEKGFNFPYLFDETQKIAKAYGAQRTPEFYVLDADRKVVYMGALDDNTDASKVEMLYVEQAIAAALKGGQPEVKETPPIGCAVRYQRVRRTRD